MERADEVKPEPGRSSKVRERAAAYGDDLAFIHDDGFGGFAREASHVLVNALQGRGITEGLVIDLGCGSGILSGVVTGRGYQALGIDISAAMIALARKRVPDATFRVETLFSVELPHCVAVAAVGECLNYLFDEGNTAPKRARLFRTIYRALAPRGLFILDVAEPGRASGAGPNRSFKEGKDWAVLVTQDEDRRRRILIRKITSFRRYGELYRRDHEVHRQRLIARSEVAGQLRSIGFGVRSLRGYGKQRFGPGHGGMIAAKP
jgi:SAM-dependent methyltransferase